MKDNIESIFGINNNEPIQQQQSEQEVSSTVNLDIRKVFEWVLYVLGVVFIIISLYYFFSDLELRSSGDIFEFHEKKYVGGDAYNFIISAARSSAVMTKGLIMAVLGCSSIIIGRLTAIVNKIG